MRRYSFLLTFLLLCTSLTFGQTTVTVTGNLQDTFGTSVVTNAKVCFSLIDGAGQPIQDPRVVSTGVIIASDTQCVNPNGSGQVSTSLVGNDQISPAGTQWSVQYYLKGQYVHGDNFIFNTPGPYNLNNATPNTTIPIVPSPTGDTTYFRLDGGNSPITGGFTARGNNTFTGSNTFQFLNAKRLADSFPGGDCGAKVNAADANLGGASGTIQVTTNCGTSWTTAISISSGHALDFDCGSYTVNTITLASNTALHALGSKCVILLPQTAAQSSVINLAGTNKTSGIVEFVRISGLQIFENLTPATNADCITMNYTGRIWLDHLTCNGFYDNITINNSSYIDFYKIRSNAATHRNLFLQFTDTIGTYFGTNFSSIDGEYDSAAVGSDYSVYATDWAGSTWQYNDITGNLGTGGMRLESINSAVDVPSGNILVGNFFDANAGYGLFANKQRECFLTSNWFSSGRTAGVDSFQGTNLSGCKFNANVSFWGGDNGFNFNGSDDHLTLTGNVSNANTHSNYRFIGVTNSTITGNSSFVKTWANGTQGAASTFGFNEDNTSSANSFIGNVSQNAVTANYSLSGTSHPIIANDDGNETISGQMIVKGSGAQGLCFGGNSGSFPCARFESATGLGIVKGDGSAYLDLSLNNLLLNGALNFSSSKGQHIKPQAAQSDISGTCTMASGSCTAIVFTTGYNSAPSCTVTWTGTGTLTGILKSNRTTTQIAPSSSVGTDTAQVDYHCIGNPN